jgi:hypothetical protein
MNENEGEGKVRSFRAAQIERLSRRLEAVERLIGYEVSRRLPRERRLRLVDPPEPKS